MLGFEQLVHKFYGEAGLHGALGVRRRSLADAVAFYEDLRLQEQIVLTRFALHVVDGLSYFGVGIESEYL
jgi:hypothetical protein